MKYYSHVKFPLKLTSSKIHVRAPEIEPESFTGMLDIYSIYKTLSSLIYGTLSKEI